MNLRPSGYEPDELPGCSTPHQVVRRVVLAPWSLAVKPRICFQGSSGPQGRVWRERTVYICSKSLHKVTTRDEAAVGQWKVRAQLLVA